MFFCHSELVVTCHPKNQVPSGFTCLTACSNTAVSGASSHSSLSPLTPTRFWRAKNVFLPPLFYLSKMNMLLWVRVKVTFFFPNMVRKLEISFQDAFYHLHDLSARHRNTVRGKTPLSTYKWQCESLEDVVILIGCSLKRSDSDWSTFDW